FDFIGTDGLHTVFIEHPGGTAGGVDPVSQLLKPSGDIDHFLFILVLYRDNHIFMTGQIDPRTQEGFVQRFIERRSDAQAFSGRLHLRSQIDVGTPDLFKGEHRHLHGDMGRLRLQTRRIAHFPDLMSQNHLRRQRYDGNPRHFTDIGHGTAGTGIDLDHINFSAADNELDVNHTHHMQRHGKTAGILLDGLFGFLTDSLSRVDGNAVSGVNAGPFDVFHDTRYQDILSVADGVHLDLFSLQIFIHQNRMFLGDPVNDADKLIHILIADGNLHPLAAQHIGRTHQYGITQIVGRLFRLFSSEDCVSLGPWNLTFFQDFIEEFPILCSVHVFRRGSQYLHTHFDQRV